MQFSATTPPDSEDGPVKIRDGNLVATVDVEADNVSTLMDYFQKVFLEDFIGDGLKKYRFEVYTLVGDKQAKLVGLQASDD